MIVKWATGKWVSITIFIQLRDVDRATEETHEITNWCREHTSAMVGHIPYFRRPEPTKIITSEHITFQYNQYILRSMCLIIFYLNICSVWFQKLYGFHDAHCFIIERTFNVQISKWIIWIIKIVLWQVALAVSKLLVLQRNKSHHMTILHTAPKRKGTVIGIWTFQIYPHACYECMLYLDLWILIFWE